MLYFLLRISLFKEMIKINEDTKMTRLYVFGFSEVQRARDLKRVLGAKTKAALWTYG